MERVSSAASAYLKAGGFESHAFKVGWYNDVVGEKFKLPYDSDTLAILILSTPGMFETIFVPMLLKEDDYLRDPLDVCIAEYCAGLKKILLNEEMHFFYDYELYPNKRPKILMQTAGHVSGAAFFYQKHHVINSPWSSNQNIYGVSIHPKYGGWFAFRVVVVFPDKKEPGLVRSESQDVVPKNEDRIRLLEMFNFNWKDNEYRNIIEPTEKYSLNQSLYFNTIPKERGSVISKIISDHKNHEEHRILSS